MAQHARDPFMRKLNAGRQRHPAVRSLVRRIEAKCRDTRCYPLLQQMALGMEVFASIDIIKPEICSGLIVFEIGPSATL
jgi:hypothetical protein